MGLKNKLLGDVIKKIEDYKIKDARQTLNKKNINLDQAQLEEIFGEVIRKDHEKVLAFISFKGEKKNTLDILRALQILISNVNNKNILLKEIEKIIYYNPIINLEKQEYAETIYKLKNAELKYQELTNADVISFFQNIIGRGFSPILTVKMIANSNFSPEVVFDLTNMLVEKFEVNKEGNFFKTEFTSIRGKISDVKGAKELTQKLY